MICLSVKTPYAYMICAGIKDVENRKWKTNYIGDLYIHASGKTQYYDLDIDLYPEQIQKKLKEGIWKTKTGYKKDAPKWYQNMYHFYHDHVMPFYGFKSADDFKSLYKLKGRDLKKYKPFFTNSAIIGKINLLGVQKNYNSYFAEKDQYNWVLNDHYLLDKPIVNIKGHLNLWKLNQEV